MPHIKNEIDKLLKQYQVQCKEWKCVVDALLYRDASHLLFFYKVNKSGLLNLFYKCKNPSPLTTENAKGNHVSIEMLRTMSMVLLHKSPLLFYTDTLP